MKRKEFLEQMFQQDQHVRPDFEAMWERIEERLSEKNGRVTRERKTVLRKLQTMSLAAAAVCLLAVTAGAYISPAFAAYLKSFFDRPTVDQGLQTAAKQGFSQEANYAVTDQGITLKVLEVLADPARVVMTVALEKDGKLLDAASIFTEEYLYNKMNEWKNSTFYLKDDNGWIGSNVVAVYPHAPYADLVFKIDHAPRSNDITVNMNIKEIGAEKGDWKLSVPVDLKKAAAATVTIPVDRKYVTEPGAVVTMKSITHSPTATLFDFEVEWTPEARARVMKQRYGYDHFGAVLFHIEDEHGNIIASSQELKGRKAPIIWKSDSVMERGEKEAYQYGFVRMDPSKKHVIVLDGLEIAEQPRVTVTFDPAELKKNPVTFKYKNHRFTFTNYSVKTDERGDRIGLLSVEGSVSGGYPGYWLVKDEQGNHYDVDENSLWENISWDKNEKGMFSSKLEIVQEEKRPSRLILELDYITTHYDISEARLPIPVR